MQNWRVSTNMVCIVSANSPKYFRIRPDEVILICLSFVLPVITGGAKIRIFISAYRVQHLSYERKLCLILQYLSDFLMTSAYLLISCHNHRSSCLTQKMGKILFLAMVSGSGYFAILVVLNPTLYSQDPYIYYLEPYPFDYVPGTYLYQYVLNLVGPCG